MLNPSLNQLRIHVEDPWTAATGLDLPAWRPLQDAYRGLTGWQLDCSSTGVPARVESLGTIPELFGNQAGHLYRQRADEAVEPAARDDHARALADALMRVFRELQSTRQALQHRESELATAIPVTARQPDGSAFNHRLQAVLRGTVESLKGQAAALYLLDDATTELKLRSHWGLSSVRYLEPARPLRGAVADLEALTGHAVVLEDIESFPHWNVPEPFASAVCVPISSPEMVLGTLWFFANEVRDYSSDETQMLEIVAGRLAVELERRVLLQEATQSREHRDQAEQVLAWHQERALQSAPMLDGWQVAGATVESGQPRGDFHTWRVADDGALWIATAAVSGPPVKSMLSSTLLQGATQASFIQAHDPTGTLRQLNEVLWRSAPGSEGASMFCGQLDPASGRLRYALAGATDAYILRPHGWEPIAVDGVPLGRDDDWHGAENVREIHPGDVLVLISDRHLARHDHPTDLDTVSLAEALLRHIHLSAKDLAGLATYLIAKECMDVWARSVLVVKRRDELA